ncbi:CHAT domain-containing protein [Lactarius psammicola]|nr:CHAT domain-containing protein [Lactarius psammicola]
MADELGSIHKIDSEITQFQHILSISSRSDPRRHTYVHLLALKRFRRHVLSNQREDLDKAIHSSHRSTTPHTPFVARIRSKILTALFQLATTLLEHSKVCNQPEDVIYAAKYLRHLRHQPHPPLCFTRHQVATMLVYALAFQVKLEAGNVMQNIDEMAVLCRELLMDASDSDTIGPITLFSDVVAKISPFAPDPPSNQVIEFLRLVRKHKPDLRNARYALACFLSWRYCMTCVNDDYEEAASIFDEIITSNSPGDGQGEFVANIQEFVTFLAGVRSVTNKTPEYSEEAMYRFRAIPSPSSNMGQFAAMAAELRFHYFGSIEGLEASSSNSPLSQPVPVSPIERFKGDPVVCPTSKKYDLLQGLLIGINNGDITEIDEAIELGRSVVASAPTPRNLFTPPLFAIFGNILFAAFERTNKIKYLNESISTHRQVLERPSIHALHSLALRQLVQSLLTRLKYLPGHFMQDLDELVKIFSLCTNDGHETLPNRFQSACAWAWIARFTQHPSFSAAYESAMSLKRDTLLFAPTLQLQHATLAMSHHTHSMPLDYASYQVGLHQLEEAVETLERGRALLWSEMRHHRTSVDQLLEADPQLGHKFAAVNRDLEELTKAVDSFGRLLLKQRGLLKERDNLISQIQALPGFNSFLTSPSFDTLRSAALSGPVIIMKPLHMALRHSESFFPTHLPPSSRPLVISTIVITIEPSHPFSQNSTIFPGSGGVRHPCFVLFLSTPWDQPHPMMVRCAISWISTSVPIPQHYPRSSNLVIVTSSSRYSDQPSLLLVAQPDPSLPTVGGEIQVVQALDTEVTSLISEVATPAAVIEAFHHHHFIHFACHGTLEAGKPFEAGFELYGGERLTLLEIVRSHLPTAEFAFLSACHTAEVTEGSVVDEGLHLAAAVQYCGFRSVVGTMWAMVDEDGRDLAEHFYKALFSNSRRVQGVPYSERSAKALRVAVKKLRRKKRITLERWVNFVHYGA